MTLNPAGHLAERLAQLEGLEAAQRVVDRITRESGASVAEISAAARIRALARSHSDLSGVGLKRIDAALRQIEAAIGQRALALSTRSFADALEVERIENRGGLLALLEILIDTVTVVDPNQLKPALNRTILRIVVSLCRPNDGASARVTCDPVFLSPGFHAWCSGTESASDSEVRACELEFFAAANLEAEALCASDGLEKRQRLIDGMGSRVFEPRVLRAVVTYEIALAAAQARPPWVDGDDSFMMENQHSFPAGEKVSGSVFCSEPLRMLGESLNQRIRGAPCPSTPEGRIAWALDLGGLRAAEQQALCSRQLATAEDPLGTTILLGLLGRQEKILGVELQELGIPPSQVLGRWREELSSVLQNEIHAALKREAYALSCAISELKARFLGEDGAALSEAEGTARPSQAALGGLRVGAQGQGPRPESARSLVEAALREPTVSRRGGPSRAQKRSALGRLGLIVVLSVAAGAAAWFFSSGLGSGIESFSPEQLQSVSPYLSSGGRNLNGVGPAFVGRFDDRWQTMQRRQRRAAAQALVDRLRRNGVSQIVIRDENDRVRLQALGQQPIRIL